MKKESDSKNMLLVSDIASFLSASYEGDNLQIIIPASLRKIKSQSVTFTKKKCTLLTEKSFLLICPFNYIYNQNCNYSIIRTLNPRLAFARVLEKFYTQKIQKEIHRSVEISNSCSIDKNVSIGKNCSIGNNVSIGAGTIINNNVVINDNTIIGNNCIIKSGSVIGEAGFGFEFDENGHPIRVPHLGSVVIGNNVEIGAKNTIARGTLDNTVLHDWVKTDDQVHIAHNCNIGENTLITACAEISGSVTIGKNCWVSPNCTIIQKIKIGDNSVIGIGSIILEDVEKNKKIMGLEGIELRKLIKLKRQIKYGQ